jgi:hypothetical protein
MDVKHDRLIRREGNHYWSYKELRFYEFPPIEITVAKVAMIEGIEAWIRDNLKTN